MKSKLALLVVIKRVSSAGHYPSAASISPATDRADYEKFITQDRESQPFGYIHDLVKLDEYLAERVPLLLADDYAPTDIMVAHLFR